MNSPARAGTIRAALTTWLRPAAGTTAAHVTARQRVAAGASPVVRVSGHFHLNLETALYLLIAILAALTRLWDLTYRGQHHDESLHSYFSWLLYAGNGYIHDPMMHGPALFHSNAFAYFLFGDNEYVTRLVPALLGIGIVLLPALLRAPHLLGRWGALSCSFLLLASPVMTYYTRFNRHDPYVLFATLLIIFSMVRFMDSRETRWIITMWVTTGFLFTTLEVSFIIGFTLATFIGLIMAWQIDRRLVKIGAATLVGVVAIREICTLFGIGGLPRIPWDDPSSENIHAFAVDLATHPMILFMLGAVCIGLVFAIRVLNQVRDGLPWLDGVLGSTGPDTTTRVMHDALSNRTGMIAGLLGGAAVFVVLYSTFFTNMAGLASGTVGALGYWLGQQDVQRGDQPWFYYLLMLPQYELVAVVLAPVGGMLALKRIIPRLRSGEPVGKRNFLWGLFLWWTLVHLAVFSWAGEKMPWLTVHMALPMILLSGGLIGDTIERLEARRPAGGLLVGGGIVAAGVAWFLLWTRASNGPWMEDVYPAARSIQGVFADHLWLLYLPALALLLIVGVGIYRLGTRSALAVSGLALVVLLVAGQMHLTYRMTFVEGDTPRDMLIYVQSSPDVTQAVEDIGLLSRELTGGKDLVIWYDSGTSWPMQWYLRDYQFRRFFGTRLTSPPDAPVVLIADEHLSGENRAMLSGYTGTEYALRWWFPEDETYRRFAIAPELNKEWRQNYQSDKPAPYSLLDVLESVWNSVWSFHAPEQQLRMFRLVAFRELPAPIGSYNFHVFVRNDLVETFNDIRY